MSRVEENAQLQFGHIRHTNANGTEIAKVKFLEDISRSLAVIADGLDNGTTSEANEYVHDYLLIQWLFLRYHINENVETEYNEWRNYLKEGADDE